MKILDLVLKGKWYDMIDGGEKPEEYRELKDYWMNRIIRSDHTEYTHVRFHRGYNNNTTMLFEINEITIGKGNPEWGAPKNKDVFIIKLGKRL